MSAASSLFPLVTPGPSSPRCKIPIPSSSRQPRRNKHPLAAQTIATSLNGEAFYRNALPKAQTLQDAFNQAKAAIALRKTQENQKASDPQAYFGTEIERVLADNPMALPGPP